MPLANGDMQDGVSNAIIGGKHESFPFFANTAGGVIASFTAGLQRFREGRMQRVSTNSITVKELQAAKISNLQMHQVEGME